MLRVASSSSRIRLQSSARVRRKSRLHPHEYGSTRRSTLTSSSKSSSKGDDSLLSVCLAWYSTKLDTHPIVTKCLTSGLVSALGDLICQSLTLPAKDNSSSSSAPSSSAEPKWDMQRTGRFAALGALWVGPILHFWYGALFQALSKRVVARVAVDQFGFAPLFVTSFLSLLWTWEGESPSTLGPRLQENVPSIVVANWALWIPAQTINFHFVPVKYHVLFSNFVALAWNAYLSYTSHESKPRKEEDSIDQSNPK